ncbi:hypothetical protein Hanom_Chr04g00293581 [Helianthus anomalus]
MYIQLCDTDVIVTYLRRVGHSRHLELEGIQTYRMDIARETIGNYVNYGIFAMHHIETWMGIIKES